MTKIILFEAHNSVDTLTYSDFLLILAVKFSKSYPKSRLCLNTTFTSVVKFKNNSVWNTSGIF
jgi:hypothetical protein